MKFLSYASLAASLLLIGQPSSAQMASIAFGETAHDDSQPIEIVSDMLSLDQASGAAAFTGNVLVVQDKLRLSADKIDVRYVVEDGNTSTDIETMTATGNVLLVNGEDKAQSSQAVYTVAQDVIVMSGDVLLHQGQTALAGQKLVLNLNDSTGVMEGRVRTILQQGSSK